MKILDIVHIFISNLHFLNKHTYPNLQVINKYIHVYIFEKKLFITSGVLSKQGISSF